MKKSVILSIGLIYIIAVVVVGIFGQKMRIYNEIVYVETINCVSEEYVEYTEEEKASKNKDGYMLYNTFTKGMKVTIKCNINPANATDTKLNFFTNNEDEYPIVSNGDNSAYIIFNKAAIVDVTIRANDGHGAQMKIQVQIMDFDPGLFD